MTKEIEEYANRMAGLEILRRGRLLADKAIRQDRQGEIAWRALLIGTIAFIPAALLATFLLSALNHSYRQYLAAGHFHAIAPAVGTDLRSPVRNAFRQEVREKLNQVGNMVSPTERLWGLDGATLLALSLHPDGSIDRAVIYGTSGQPALDRRACEIAILAAPFSPFPKGMQGLDKMWITDYMVFNLGDTPVDGLLSNTKRTNAYDCDGTLKNSRRHRGQ